MLKQILFAIGSAFLVTYSSLYSPPAAAQDPFPYTRRYKDGETFAYKYKQTFTGPDNSTRVVEGSTIHKVTKVDLNLAEQVTWTSLTVTEAGQKPQDYSGEARQVGAITLALPPAGRSSEPIRPSSIVSESTLELVRLYQILDVNILDPYLRKAGDKHTSPPAYFFSGGTGSNPRPAKAECFENTTEIVSLTEKTLKIRSRQFPPNTCPGFKLLAPVMTEKFPGHAQRNNFAQVVPAGGKFSLSWGTEEIVNEAEFDIASGIMLNARSEINSVRQLRDGCDQTFKKCQPLVDAPITSKRVLEITLAH